MDKLWAPWRIKYVSRKKETGCVFCRIPKQNRDKKNRIFLRSSRCFAVLNQFPYNNGHLLVAPYRHTPDLGKLTNKEIIDIHKTMTEAKKLLQEVLNPDGFNLGLNTGKAAGAGITGHIHFHLLPRWEGDTNFLPVFSGTKVISQSLDDLYAKLKKHNNEK